MLKNYFLNWNNLEISDLRREEHISCNRNSSNRSNDQRSAEAAAGHVGKENDASALNERSRSERNALQPLVSPKAIDKVSEREGVPGLSVPVADDTLQQPASIDETWCAPRFHDAMHCEPHNAGYSTCCHGMSFKELIIYSQRDDSTVNCYFCTQ